MKEEIISFETAELANKKGAPYSDLMGTIDLSQSNLQKWLREEHGIHILMNITVKGNYSCNIYIQGSKEIVKKADVRSDNKESYEEVLEIGLQEALKLIDR